MNQTTKITIPVSIGILFILIICTLHLNPTQVGFAEIGVFSPLLTPAELGCWFTRPDLPTPRSALAAVELDGMIYTIGGRDDGSTGVIVRYDTFESYDPTMGTWTTLPSMPTARGWLVAAAVDGKIYAIGGSNSSGKRANVEEYDPSTNSWSIKTPMPTPRDDIVVGVVDGKIYVIGGWNAGPLTEVEEYDPNADNWTTKAPMPQGLAMASSAVVGGKIYVMGGLNGQIREWTYEYDPAMNTWVIKADMPTARSRLTASEVDGKIYAIGGYNSDTGWQNVVERYDPGADSWVRMNAMPTTRGEIASAQAAGLIYVFGGRNTFGGPVLGVSEAGDFTCTNNPPDEPYDPLPGWGWENRSLCTAISWSPDDPDSAEPLTYDVYMGDNPMPPLVSFNQTNNLYEPQEMLQPYTTYYWRINARDNHGAVTLGPRWSFTTGGTRYQIVNGNFEVDVTNWVLETHPHSEADLIHDTTTAGEGAASAKVEVTVPGPSLDRVRMTQSGLELIGGHRYILSFWAMSSIQRDIGIVLRMSSPPYTEYLSDTEGITDTWQEYEYDFIAPVTDPDVALQFNLGGGEDPSDVWLDGIRLFNPNFNVCLSANPVNLTVPGGLVEFKVSIKNTTEDAVELTSLWDSAFGDVTNDSNPSLISTNCDLLDIPSGGFYQCSYWANVTGSPENYTNTLTATAQGDITYVVLDDVTISIIHDPPPEFTVEKSAEPPSLSEPGGIVTFTVEITNDGSEQIWLTSLVDNMYGDITDTVNSNLLSTDCMLATIFQGGVSECSFQAEVSGDPGIHTNSVVVYARDNENTTTHAFGDASVTIIDIPPDFTVEKRADPSILSEPGGIVTFTVEITNDGSEQIWLTSLVDNMYGDISDTVNPNLVSTNCMLETIIEDDTYECSFQAEVSGEPGIHTNSVVVYARDNEYTNADASGDASVTITDLEPTLDVSYASEPGMIRSGDLVTFTVQVQNLSVETAIMIGLYDSSFGDMVGECGPLPILDIGQIFSCGFRRTINGDHNSTITATVQDNEVNVISGFDSASVDVIFPSIQVYGAANKPVVSVGETISFTYTVRNTGDVELVNIIAQDDLLGEITLGNTSLMPGEDTIGYKSYLAKSSDLPGPITTTVTVIGTPPVGPDVTDSHIMSTEIEEPTIYLPLINKSFSQSSQEMSALPFLEGVAGIPLLPPETETKLNLLLRAVWDRLTDWLWFQN